VRKLLFVSYYVPPRPGVATARTRMLLAKLPSLGWEVTPVTARLDGTATGVLETRYVDVRALVKRAIGLGNGSTHAALQTAPAAFGARIGLRQRAALLGFQLTTYPDAQIGWLLGLGDLARLLHAGNFDAVISSAPPFTTNLMLRSVGPGIPWLADFRDLWTDSDAYSSRLRRFFDALLERWSLRHATALTTLSEPMAQALRLRHPGKRVEVIANAFDAEEWQAVPFEMELRCTLLYAGSLYHGRRDPRPLFRAIRSLLDGGALREDDIAVDLYSPSEPWLDEAIATARLENVVRVRGNISRSEILAAQRRADRLLVLLWSGPGSEGVVTGKIFEYLGARRRILTTGGPARSAVDDILTASGAGVRCTEQPALEREILQAVEEHRARAVRVVGEEGVAPFEASAMARRFALILDEIAPRRQPRTLMPRSPRAAR
jgi:hypothetical protein